MPFLGYAEFATISDFQESVIEKTANYLGIWSRNVGARLTVGARLARDRGQGPLLQKPPDLWERALHPFGHVARDRGQGPLLQ